MKRSTPLIILSLVVFGACSHKSAQQAANCCATTFDIPLNNQPTSYFPSGTFLPDELRDKHLVDWYARSLNELGEPSFQSMAASNLESYRFLWLRSFHPGVAIRVWRCPVGYCITSKQLDSIDRYTDGKFVPTAKLAVNNSRPLRANDWDRFLSLLNGAQFWSLPTVDGKPMANDGAAWLLEGTRASNYHVVDRQSPVDGAYRDACLYLLTLSQLKVDASKHELY
jgi:hypothetical protein